jgi:hypothetical protein
MACRAVTSDEWEKQKSEIKKQKSEDREAVYHLIR